MNVFKLEKYNYLMCVYLSDIWWVELSLSKGICIKQDSFLSSAQSVYIRRYKYCSSYDIFSLSKIILS